MKTSQIEFCTRLPAVKPLKSGLLIYDSFFDKKILLEQVQDKNRNDIQKWIQSFPNRLAVDAGESLKNLKSFPDQLEKILGITAKMPAQDLKLISLGGGSVGDFVGFVASILKRGVPLIHIPTTWLAAIDSSHGGKTALNVAGFKNQIGSFYPAEKVILVKPILLSQPTERAFDAYGEAVKMALIQGGPLWNDIENLKNFDGIAIWKLLPALIKGKYNIVKKDPYETKGIRQLLNLGHTLGHVWELSSNLSHGTAVAYGLRAALEFSLSENVLSEKNYETLNDSKAIEHLPSRTALTTLIRSSKIDIEKTLLQDKKMTSSGNLRFIFITGVGKCRVQQVSIKKLIAFYKSFGR